MSVDLRADLLKMLIQQGDAQGARDCAIQVLRGGNVDDMLAKLVADALTTKKRRGRPPDGTSIELARAILDAKYEQPRGRQKLEAAQQEAADALGMTLGQAKRAWRKWGAALEELRAIEVEDAKGRRV